MSEHKRRFFTMLLTIAVFATIGSTNPTRNPGPLLRVETSGAADGVQPAIFFPVQSLFRAQSFFLAQFFFPAQLKNAENLHAGMLLVASRGLADPLFARTVILLVRYDEKGVLGLVLNRRTDVPLSRVLDLKAAKKSSEPVYLGGPVGPSAVFALFRSPSKIEKAENIFGEVYLISDKALFERTISAQPAADALHVYLGYAGWTEEQLRNEVQLGAWFVFPGDASTVFNADPGSLWLRMIRRTELQFAKGSEAM